MSYLSRISFFSSFAGILFVSLISSSCHADESLSKAASSLRENNYEESFTQAAKSSESAQRTFIMGVASLRRGKPLEALPLLAEAERKLPLIGDYAAIFQVDALMKLKRYREAEAKAASILVSYPETFLIRRSEKCRIDSLIAAGKYSAALKLCHSFIEKYPSADQDSLDALFLYALCREETGDKDGAAVVYRKIWLDSPVSRQAKDSRNRLLELKKTGVAVSAFTPEELFLRASNFAAKNHFSRSLETLNSIPFAEQRASLVDHIRLRAGLNYYRLKQWKNAEEALAQAAAGGVSSVRSEARFWYGKTLARQKANEQAFALFTEMAEKGPKQAFASEALLEAADIRKSEGNYSEAAHLYEQIGKNFPKPSSLSRANWEAGWCYYLAGEYPKAITIFKALLKEDGARERSLYWLGRSLENMGDADSRKYFSMLLNEFPSGFYSTWRREHTGIKDTREKVTRETNLTPPSLPPEYNKARFLAAMGLMREARFEIAAIRKKNDNRKDELLGLARFYQNAGDYQSSILLFRRNVPEKWEKESLAFWSAGYPLAYSEKVEYYTGVNNLPESLIYALIRAESNFSPAVKSSAGAIGLMQLMPATAKETALENDNFNTFRLTSPDYNIMLGTRHFRELLDIFDGDEIYSMAAYNAGRSAVRRWQERFKGFKKDEFIESIPYQETRNYVKSIYASAAIYRQLYGLR